MGNKERAGGIVMPGESVVVRDQLQRGEKGGGVRASERGEQTSTHCKWGAEVGYYFALKHEKT